MFFFFFAIITSVCDYCNCLRERELYCKKTVERLQTRRPCQFLLLGLDKGHHVAASHKMDHPDINEN